YRIPPERIAVTPLAADPRFRPQPPAAVTAVRAKYDLPESYILTLSSNKPHKNLVCLIEAFAHVVRAGGRDPQSALHNVQLVIAGHWDPRYPEAQELATRPGLDPVLRFLPGATEIDLPALYSGATVFAFPSLYEGFGFPP